MSVIDSNVLLIRLQKCVLGHDWTQLVIMDGGKPMVTLRRCRRCGYLPNADQQPAPSTQESAS